MEALRAGDGRQAAAAFTRFLVEHPRDPMAEDAAYLRIIALQRAGASADVKRAAEEYLQRFPTGFRRAEVEKL
jgi:outer membrane protein assembly factor BamD (BamD/ComL family)